MLLMKDKPIVIGQKWKNSDGVIYVVKEVKGTGDVIIEQDGVPFRDGKSTIIGYGEGWFLSEYVLVEDEYPILLVGRGFTSIFVQSIRLFPIKKMLIEYVEKMDCSTLSRYDCYLVFSGKPPEELDRKAWMPKKSIKQMGK